MAQPLALWHGRRLAIVPAAPARPTFVRVVGELDAVALQILGEEPLVVAPGDRPALEAAGSAGLVATAPGLRRQLSALGIPTGEASALRARHAALRLEPPPAEREVALAVAKAMLARAQRDPVETLIALSREEERLERSLGRELNAQEELLGGWGEANPELAEEVLRFRETFSRHHARIEAELDLQVRRVAPTLAAVTGSKVASRLIAAANGLQALSRMPAGRVQLLGVRRRPLHGPGPRHGVVYRALGMETLPWSRQGAYARSLAASAVIAARIDLMGGSEVQAARLVRRLDRRRTALRRGG